MRTLVGILLAGFVATAAAGGDTLADARYADGNDYSAKLFYSLNFGGTQGHSQAMGLRFDNEIAAARGAPALFQASFDGQGLPSVKLQGVDVAGPAMAAGQSEGGGNPFAAFGMVEWVAFGATALIFTIVAVDVTDDEGEPARGTGSGS